MPPSKVLVALPLLMLHKTDHIATMECRTRSDLIREALREYIGKYEDKHGELELEKLKPLNSKFAFPKPEVAPVSIQALDQITMPSKNE